MSRRSHRTGRSDRRSQRRRRTTPGPWHRASVEGKVRAAARVALARGETPRTATRNGHREDSDLVIDRTGTRRGDA